MYPGIAKLIIKKKVDKSLNDEKYLLKKFVLSKKNIAPIEIIDTKNVNKKSFLMEAL